MANKHLQAAKEAKNDEFKHNLGKEFDIIGTAHDGTNRNFDLFKPVVNGNAKFPRILIRAKKGVKF